MERNVAPPEVAYGFIGLGNMGFPMALNLRAKISRKTKLIICDVIQAKTDRFLAQAKDRDFVRVSTNPRNIVEEASMIITMLPTSAEVKDVFNNPTTGLLSA
jgi:3-hydroxyisobutyrate/3-hydroxypropionate dehydrogenase